ncbi:MAG: hypothetical protein WCT50_01620 [Patescibacteria group bacterium]
MNQKTIFFDQGKPYLVFLASALFLQLDGDVMVEPTSIEDLSKKEFIPKEEAYILDIAPETNQELSLWTNFRLRNEGKIKLWVFQKHEQANICLQAFLQAGYRLSSDWIQTALETSKNVLATENKQAERWLRAYEAQRSLDFNTNHQNGVNKLIIKMINELIAGETNREISTLAEIQKEAEKKMEANLRFWKKMNLSGPYYRGYPFQKIPLFSLGEEEINFLNLHGLIQLIFDEKKIINFVLEYNCRGKIHYLLFNKGMVINRKTYANVASMKSIRIKAAEKLLYA